jgi:hypothetical protein
MIREQRFDHEKQHHVIATLRHEALKRVVEVRNRPMKAFHSGSGWGSDSNMMKKEPLWRSSAARIAVDSR